MPFKSMKEFSCTRLCLSTLIPVLVQAEKTKWQDLSGEPVATKVDSVQWWVLGDVFLYVPVGLSALLDHVL